MENPFMDEHFTWKCFFAWESFFFTSYFFCAHSCPWFLNISIWTIESGYASKLSRKCEDHFGQNIFFNLFLKMLSPKHLIKNLLGTIRSFITLIYNFLLFFFISFVLLQPILCLNFPMCYKLREFIKIKDFCMKFLNSTETETELRKKNESFEK